MTIKELDQIDQDLQADFQALARALALKEETPRAKIEACLARTHRTVAELREEIERQGQLLEVQSLRQTADKKRAELEPAKRAVKKADDALEDLAARHRQERVTADRAVQEASNKLNAIVSEIDRCERRAREIDQSLNPPEPTPRRNGFAGFQPGQPRPAWHA
jgi:chromosome segregation ATPase